MEFKNIQEKGLELIRNYDNYMDVAIYIELHFLQITEEEFKVASERIKETYWNVDYSTLQGAATAYGNWLYDVRLGKRENTDDNWLEFYMEGEWR